MTKKISIDDLKQKLLEHNRAAPITIITRTEANARKNPFGKIYKVSKVNGFIGTNYEASVRTQEIREGHLPPKFDVSPRSWGEKVNNCLVENPKTGESYLSIRPLKVMYSPRYFVEQDGKLKRVCKKVVEPYLVESKVPTNQGLEKPIIYRNYKLCSIKKIRIGGEFLKVL